MDGLQVGDRKDLRATWLYYLVRNNGFELCRGYFRLAKSAQPQLTVRCAYPKASLRGSICGGGSKNPIPLGFGQTSVGVLCSVLGNAYYSKKQLGHIQQKGEW